MSEINKIYIVTKGSYSDYSIYGVFVDKDLAEEYAEQISASNDKAGAEEWDISDSSKLPLPPKFKTYEIVMNKDGDVPALNYDFSKDLQYPGNYKREDCKAKYGIYGSDKEHYYFYVTTDKGGEGAIKIANERRIKLIAENKW